MRGRGKIVDLVRVVREIVEFFRRAREPECGLHGIGFAGLELLEPYEGGRRDHLVAHMHASREFRTEVTHVNVAAIGDRADCIHTLIRPTAKAEHVFLRACDVFAEKRVSLHPRGRFDTHKA